MAALALTAGVLAPAVGASASSQAAYPPASPGGIRQVSRVGIRMYLSIGPGNAPCVGLPDHLDDRFA